MNIRINLNIKILKYWGIKILKYLKKRVPDIVLVILLTTILTPSLLEYITVCGIKTGVLDTPELEIIVARDKNIENMCIDLKHFYGQIPWKESYQVYIVSVRNPSNILIEDFTLEVRLFGKIVDEYSKGCTELDHTFRPLSIDAFWPLNGNISIEESVIDTQGMPVRILYIPRIPMEKELALIVLVDTDSDPLIELMMGTLNEKLKPGEYSGNYQWNTLNKRMIEPFSGFSEVIEPN